MGFLRFVVRFSLAFIGWAIFTASWLTVATPTLAPPRYVVGTFKVLGGFSFAVLAASVIWVGHNVRIGRRDRRNKISRVHQVSKANDHLERPIELHNIDTAQVITVSIVNEAKIFDGRAATAAQAAGAD